jgi:hypothetical protein
MTSGNRTPTTRARGHTLRLCWMMLLSSAALPWAAAQPAAEQPGPVDAGWVLARLARPAPMRTSFVEVRESKLLKEPLRLSGEYLRPREDTLVRQVRSPYLETTTIVSAKGDAGQATIERAGKSRTYSLTRVPELASLQSSFGAMLAGDQARLERDFRIASQGTRARWTLVLTPKDAGLATRLKQIQLYGRGAELRCIETVPAKGIEVQRTLLATAARAAGDEADAVALTALCHGEAR